MQGRKEEAPQYLPLYPSPETLMQAKEPVFVAVVLLMILPLALCLICIVWGCRRIEYVGLVCPLPLPPYCPVYSMDFQTLPSPQGLMHAEEAECPCTCISICTRPQPCLYVLRASSMTTSCNCKPWTLFSTGMLPGSTAIRRGGGGGSKVVWGKHMLHLPKGWCSGYTPAGMVQLCTAPCLGVSLKGTRWR